jgi:protein tyrosine phosphatase
LQNEFDLLVRISAAAGSQGSSATVRVRIDDINDNDPVLEVIDAGVTVVVSEIAPIGTNLFHVLATDLDRSSQFSGIKYSMTSVVPESGGGIFNIANGQEGVSSGQPKLMTLTAQLPYSDSTRNRFTISIAADNYLDEAHEDCASIAENRCFGEAVVEVRKFVSTHTVGGGVTDMSKIDLDWTLPVDPCRDVTPTPVDCRGGNVTVESRYEIWSRSTQTPCPSGCGASGAGSCECKIFESVGQPSAEDSRHTLEEVAGNTRYEFQLRISPARGQGASHASTWHEFMTEDYEISVVQATIEGSDVRVSWGRPVQSNGAFVKYSICWSSSTILISRGCTRISPTDQRVHLEDVSETFVSASELSGKDLSQLMFVVERTTNLNGRSISTASIPVAATSLDLIASSANEVEEDNAARTAWVTLVVLFVLAVLVAGMYVGYLKYRANNATGSFSPEAIDLSRLGGAGEKGPPPPKTLFEDASDLVVNPDTGGVGTTETVLDDAAAAADVAAAEPVPGALPLDGVDNGHWYYAGEEVTSPDGEAPGSNLARLPAHLASGSIPGLVVPENRFGGFGADFGPPVTINETLPGYDVPGAIPFGQLLPDTSGMFHDDSIEGGYIDVHPLPQTHSNRFESAFQGIAHTEGTIEAEVLVSTIDERIRSGLLETEFQKIREEEKRSDATFFVANEPQNIMKNRYNNVKPLDATRVLLQAGGIGPGDDYINANYCDGWRNNRTYIATQGPIPNTIAHFWEMIWEQRVGTIVMATKEMEMARLKCHKYWPDPNGVLHAGPIEVFAAGSDMSNPDFTVRRFRIKVAGEERTVVQLQILSWPDQGVPQSPAAMLDYLSAARTAIEETAEAGLAGPAVVHCSAGIGRSGTFIAIDICLRRLLAVGNVDIMATVNYIRKQRFGSVQTFKQYKFIYEAVRDFAIRNGKQLNVHPATEANLASGIVKSPSHDQSSNLRVAGGHSRAAPLTTSEKGRLAQLAGSDSPSPAQLIAGLRRIPARK